MARPGRVTRPRRRPTAKGPAGTRSPAEFGLEGLWLTVDAPPATLREVKRRLTVRRSRYEPVEGEPGYGRVAQRVAFAHRQEDRLLVPPGLADRVAGLLDDAGFEVVPARRTVSPAAVPDRDVCGRLPAAEREVLEAVARHPRCVVECGSERLVVHAATGLLAGFPKARTLFVAADTAGAEDFRSRLRNVACTEVELLTTSCRHTRQRIAVADPHAFNSQNLLDEWDLVVVTDATAVGKQTRMNLLGCVYQRVVGLARAERLRGLSDYAAMEVEAVCGPVACGFGVRGARVLLVPFEGEPPRPPATLAAKRRLWHVAERNRFVAELAEGLAKCGPVVLEGGGGALGGCVVDFTNRSGVAVLVESAGHAAALAELLPGWAVGVGGRPAGVDRRHTRHRARHTRRIVTAHEAHRRGVPAGVVVRADGGTLSDGCLNLRGVHGEADAWREADRNATLIVDVVAGDASAQGRRTAEYRRLGWTVLSTECTGGAMMRNESMLTGAEEAQSHDAQSGNVTIDWIGEQYVSGGHDLRYVLD